MPKSRRETGFYALALLLGLAVRLIGLGAQPLNDAEAGWALQALHIVNSQQTAMGSQPGYVVLTAALFFIFGGTSNALARLIPALVGSGLVLVPALFRERLKPRPAVLLAFAIALEPGLAAISRQAGSGVMALTFALAAWGLWSKRRFDLAGICGGMALLSGPALWPGLLGLALTGAFVRLFARDSEAKPRRKGEKAEVTARAALKVTGLYAFGTIALLGSMFMLIPAGLSAWAASLPDYIRSWSRGSDISPWVMLQSLIAYQPLGVLMALAATVRGWIQDSQRVQRLSLWMGMALLVAIFNPSRQVTDAAWFLIPLWALAALEARRWISVDRSRRNEVMIATAWGASILVFVWLNALGLIRPGLTPDMLTVRVWLLAGSVSLLVVSLLLIAVGWSIDLAKHGASWSLTVFLGVISLGALMAATGHRVVPNGAELWQPGAQLPMADLLRESVQNQSEWSNKDPNIEPVVIAGIDSPALEWLLRDRPVEVRMAAGAAARPPMVITRETDDPLLASAYRGQSFVWRSTPVWKVFNLADWLPFHEATHENEKVILWVRSDLFPNTRSQATP